MDVPQVSTLSASMRFLMNAYNSCLSGHAGCRRGSSYRPKRVIDISEPLYRLYEPDSRMEGDYVALSYSWGDKGLPMTTMETYEGRKLGFGQETVPIVFRDAASIAQRLGIKYLWVDTLCIIQDSTADWEEQAAQMGDIFEGSALTIAASASPDPGVSLFGARRDEYQAIELVSDVNEVFKDVVFKVRRKIARGIHSKTGRSLELDPLETRAWALQEKLLSTRLIAFTGGELQFSCRTSRSCECRQKSYSSPPLFSVPSHISSLEQYLKWSKNWSKVVEEYSGRNLRIPEDKLPALSGLASKFALATGFAYIAGLWKETLMYDLSWQRDSDLRKAPSTWLGPSFSWVSIQGAVSYRFARYSYPGIRTHHTELIAVQYETVGHGPYSRAGYGSSLTVCGYTVMAFLRTSWDDPQSYEIRIGHTYYTPNADKRAVCEFSIDAYTMPSVADETWDPSKCVSQITSLDKPDRSMERQILLLSLYSIQHRDDIYQVFLILERSQHTIETYERIGIGSGKIYDGNDTETDGCGVEGVLEPFQWLSVGLEQRGQNATKQRVCIQ
jgi:hypothetical protein